MDTIHRGVKADREYGKHGKPIKSIQEKRICAFDGCDTILSIYNKTKFCWMHDERLALIPTEPFRKIRDNA